MANNPDIELHPFTPWIPQEAKVLIMGTFPPQKKRWAMEFYYPNRTNDFWKIMGLLFMGNAEALVDKANKSYNLERIKELLTEKGIAMSDTGHAVKRLKDNASDKFLEIVEPVDLDSILEKIPMCRAVCTTGEKASQVVAMLTSTEAPKMGEYTNTPSGLELWRMPSTSRAYPLALEKKAEYYANMFRHIGLLPN